MGYVLPLYLHLYLLIYYLRRILMQNHPLMSYESLKDFDSKVVHMVYLVQLAQRELDFHHYYQMQVLTQPHHSLVNYHSHYTLSLLVLPLTIVLIYYKYPIVKNLYPLYQYLHLIILWYQIH